MCLNYTNDSNDKCERDMGYNPIGGDPNVLDQRGGLLYDLRYGGNEQARYLDQHIGMAHYHKLMVIEIQKERLKNFVHG